MPKIVSYLLLVALAACSRTDFPPAAQTACRSPFIGVGASDASSEDRQILKEASEDFCAVVSGKLPIHARFDDKADLPSDGGTTFYIGRKYKLTALNSLASFGGFSGYAHGPIITFDESFSPGNTNAISSITVYPVPTAR